ncbi:MAG: alpha/beta fold hydrolase [Pseudomonadota bacterium]
MPTGDTEARALVARLENQAEQHRIAVGARQVVFRRIGEGSPLVLLHGGHGSWLHWIRNVDTLARRHTLWLPDMAGYGASDVAEGPPTLANLAATMAAAIAALLGDTVAVDIAGFSFGGLTAAHVAALRPAVRRVALLGPSGHGTSRRDRLHMQDWKELPDGAERDARLRHNMAALMLHRDAAGIDPLALAIHRAACVATRFRSQGYARRPLIQPALAALAARQVPVLLVWGEHDVTARPEEASAALAEVVPGLPWHVVPGAGHWVQYEGAAATNTLLDGWFA